jgi:ferric-dicitrate binding protein FerR (iron transport regulator)
VASVRIRVVRVFAVLVLLALPGAVFAANGTIVYTEGGVSLRDGSGTREAAIGDQVGPGSVILTGAKSLAVIDLTNATTVKLREKTSLAIDSIGESTSVTLSAGAVFTSIARKLTGRFAVQTQGAVCGVRGTEFFVAYGRTIDAKPDVWMCVNDGTVEVSIPQTGQTVLVPKGLGINIVGGEKITAPRAYAWTRKLNWNLDPQSGAVEDRTSLEQAYADLLNQDYD